MNEVAKIRTYTGRLVDVLDMKPSDIDILDIARALSLNNRFNGHTRFGYSVAEHSLRGSFEIEPRLALAFLLHDASEAYIADISSPVKRLAHMDYYRQVEASLEVRINVRFGVTVHESPGDLARVKAVDTRMLATEQRDLMRGSDMEGKKPYGFVISRPCDPETIETEFLDRFYQLCDPRST